MSITHNRNSVGVVILLLSVGGCCRCPVCLWCLEASTLTVYVRALPLLST